MADLTSDTRLLRESRWLRRLARSLAQDDAHADELAQEAMQRALEHRPRFDERGPRPWLATVVRNLARIDRRRAARFRALDEERVPATSDPDPVAGAAERADLHRHVVSHLLELEPPLRDVLLLRYVDGLSEREIAKRLDLPRETVRTRRRRGLQQLRARLDGSHGSRAAWLGPLLALRAQTPESPLPYLLTVSTKTTVALAALVLAVLAGFVLQLTDANTPELTDTATASDHADPSGGPRVGESLPAREQVSDPRDDTPAAPTPTLAPWFASGRVLAEEDRSPLAGATVELRRIPGDRDGGGNGVRTLETVTTDDDGAFRVPGVALRRAASLDVVVLAEGRARVTRQVPWDRELAMPHRTRLGDLLVPPGTTVGGRVLDHEGVPMGSASVYLVPECIPQPHDDYWAISRDAREIAVTNANGDFQTTRPLTARRITPPLLVAVHDRGCGWQRLDGLRHGAHRIDDVELRLAKPWSLQVRVVDPAGAPIADCNVIAIPGRGPLGQAAPGAELALAPFHGHFQARTDQGGFARIAGLPWPDEPHTSIPWTLHLRTESGAATRHSILASRSSVEHRVEIPAATDWKLAIRVTDDALQPIAAATLEIEGLSAETDRAGMASVAMRGDRNGPWTVHARAPGYLPARTLVERPQQAAAPTEVHLELQRGRPLHGVVVDDEGIPQRGLRVSVRTAATFTDESGAFAFDAATREAFRLIVEAEPPRAPLVLDVPAEGRTDLPLRIELPPANSGTRLVAYLRDAHGLPLEAREAWLTARGNSDGSGNSSPAVELDGRIGMLTSRRPLPPGAWRLAIRTFGGAELVSDFRTEPGMAELERHLTAPPESAIELRLQLPANTTSTVARIDFGSSSQRAGVLGAGNRTPLQQQGSLPLGTPPVLTVVGRDPDRPLDLTITAGGGVRATVHIPPGPAPAVLDVPFASEVRLTLEATSPWPEDRAGLFLWRDGEPRSDDRPLPLVGLRGRTQLFSQTVSPGVWHYELRQNGAADGAIRAAGRIEVRAGAQHVAAVTYR